MVSIGIAGNLELGVAFAVSRVGLEALHIAILLILDEHGEVGGRQEFAVGVGLKDPIFCHGAGCFAVDANRVYFANANRRFTDQRDYLKEVVVGLVVTPRSVEDVADLDAELVDLFGGLDRLFGLDGLAVDGGAGGGFVSVAVPHLFDAMPTEFQGLEGVPNGNAGLAVEGDLDGIEGGVMIDGVSHG